MNARRAALPPLSTPTSLNDSESSWLQMATIGSSIFQRDDLCLGSAGGMAVLYNCWLFGLGGTG